MQPSLDGLGLVRWLGWAFAHPANETCCKEKGRLAELIQLSATSKQIGGSGKKKTKLKGSAHFQQTLLFNINKLMIVYIYLSVWVFFHSIVLFGGFNYQYYQKLIWVSGTMEWRLH